MPEMLRPDATWGGALALLAYLLGSVSFGLVLARRRGVDLRSTGSGNVGATNVARVLGRRAGHIVMVLDALKGFIPALLAHASLGVPHAWTSIVGAAAALGHVFPVWHRFRGGKAAATALGVLLATTPVAGAVGIAVFFALKRLTRRASAGSLVALPLATGVEWAQHGVTVTLALCVVLTALVYVRHMGNLQRLLTGREPPS